MTVEIILSNKDPNVHTVHPGDSVMDAAKVLWQESIGAAVVSEDGAHIKGIVSERDIVRVLADIGADGLNLPVSTVMTRDVKTAKSKDRALSVMGMMNRHGIGHVPIVDEENIIGLVSIRDIIKRRLDEVESDAVAMREYIGSA